MNPLHITQRAAAGTLERLGYSAVAPTLRRSAPIAALLFLSPATVVATQERGAKDQINVGIAKSASPQVRRNAEAEKALRVEPTRTFEYADHVANGIAMRNRTAGTIHLRGAPVPSKVLVALLYFNFSDGSRDGQRNVPVLFNANRVVATRPAITTIHAGEWRAITPMWRRHPTSADWRRSEPGLSSGPPI
jgi:hypothetical protein